MMVHELMVKGCCQDLPYVKLAGKLSKGKSVMGNWFRHVAWPASQMGKRHGATHWILHSVISRRSVKISGSVSIIYSFIHHTCINVPMLTTLCQCSGYRAQSSKSYLLFKLACNLVRGAHAWNGSFKTRCSMHDKIMHPGHENSGCISAGLGSQTATWHKGWASL